MDNEKEIVLRKIKNLNSTALLYGGWGIGKTSFVRNELYEELKKEENVIYIDSRIFDRDENVFDFLSEKIMDFRSKKDKLATAGKTTLKMAANALIISSNVMLKTNIETIKFKEEKNTVPKAISKSNDMNIYIFVDELDRVTPDTLINTLNFINGLSSLDKKIKIIAIGNYEEMNNVISNRFGFSNDKDFLYKYFEDRIDLSVFAKFATDKILGEVFSVYFNDIKINIFAREAERIMKKYNRVKEQYADKFSDGVFLAALFGEVDRTNYIIIPSEIYFRIYNKTFPAQFFVKFKNGDKRPIKTNDTNSWGEPLLSPIRDLSDNFKLNNFDLWVDKYFEFNDDDHN